MEMRYTFNIKSWLPSRQQWIFAGECIQEEERKRIMEFVFKEDCKASLMGRILMRYALCKSTEQQWNKIYFERSEKGKPIFDRSKTSPEVLREIQKYSFNISHNGSYVVAVTDHANQVGVDVMNVTERHGDVENFFKLMTRNFTQHEWDCIRSQEDDSQKMRMFYRHWCLKESFVKAIGKGIGYSLQKLSFDVESNSKLECERIYCKTRLNINGVLNNEWRFEETMIDAEHCAAIATEIGCADSTFENTNTFKEIDFRKAEECLQILSPITEDFLLNFEKKKTKS